MVVPGGGPGPIALGYHVIHGFAIFMMVGLVALLGVQFYREREVWSAAAKDKGKKSRAEVIGQNPYYGHRILAAAVVLQLIRACDPFAFYFLTPWLATLSCFRASFSHGAVSHTTCIVSYVWVGPSLSSLRTPRLCSWLVFV